MHVAQRGGLACLLDSLRSRVGTTRFTRTARLTGSTQFQRVFKHAQLQSADTVLTVLAVSNNLDYARLGMAISRKSVRLAVARSRIKRLIRESFRAHQPDLSGLDIVVIGKPGIDRKTKAVQRKALEQHWKRLIQQCKNC